MAYGAWCHPQPSPRGSILSRIARASHALAGARWSDADIRVYARALTALPADAARSFDTEEGFLQQIAEAARQLAAVPRGSAHVPQNVRYRGLPAGAGSTYSACSGSSAYGRDSARESRSNGPGSPAAAAVSAAST